VGIVPSEPVGVQPSLGEFLGELLRGREACPVQPLDGEHVEGRPAVGEVPLLPRLDQRRRDPSVVLEDAGRVDVLDNFVAYPLRLLRLVALGPQRDHVRRVEVLPRDAVEVVIIVPDAVLLVPQHFLDSGPPALRDLRVVLSRFGVVEVTGDVLQNSGVSVQDRVQVDWDNVTGVRIRKVACNSQFQVEKGSCCE